jgi:flagellar assembly protein FliH
MSSDRNGGTAISTATAPEPFRYRQSGTASGNGSTLDPGIDSGEGEDTPSGVKDLQRQAFEQGRQHGEAQVRAAAQLEIAAEREKVTLTIERFKAERTSYFSHIESQVVQLALAIARKILHREAQMDPLLLTGMVHVALEKLDAGTSMRMRTHPSDIRLWSEYFAQQGTVNPSPELIGDNTLRRGECILETESGSTQMSLDSQLKEIEQGFLDLLEQRPQVS